MTTMTDRRGRRPRRSLVIAAAAGAVALATTLAPAANAVVSPDPSGTVTVTADPVTTDPAAPATATDPTAATAAATDPTAATAAAATPTPAATPAAGPKPQACKADVVPAAPWRLVATRDAEDPTIAKVDWSGVACATRYNVSVFVSGRDSVDTIPAASTSYELSSLDPAKTYAIQVSSRNDAGKGTSSTVFYLRPVTPGGVEGMKIAYNAIDGAVLSWKAPSTRQPVMYYLSVTRVSTKAVIIERKIDGDRTEQALEGLDARGMFVVVLQPVNKAGYGPKSRLVIGDENPNPVKSVAAIRDPGNAKQVIVSWLASDNTLKGSVLGYEVAYGTATADKSILVKDTDAEVTIPADQSVVVTVRVITDRGKSRWSKAVRVPLTDAPKLSTTDQRIDLLDQDGVISVAATQAVASNHKLVVRIMPTANNGGFTETQYSQAGAQVMTFRKVPDGSYLVIVDSDDQEMARRYINVGKVGMMGAADWVVLMGKAGLTDATVDMTNGGETRVFSTRPFTTQDMVLETKAHLQKGQGYGIWFRATAKPGSGNVAGLTVQYDPGYANKFIIRQWNNGSECGVPIASTPFPSGMKVYEPHAVVVAAQGDTLFVTIDGQKLFDVPSLSKAIAANSCKYPAPTGTMVGLRTWGTSSTVFSGTTVR
jgi:hypothetical protein